VCVCSKRTKGQPAFVENLRRRTLWEEHSLTTTFWLLQPGVIAFAAD
jgi:hypothetical protein